MKKFYETLKKGDIFWESEQCGNAKGIVKTDPKWDGDKFSFVADITLDGINITPDVNYLITKGYEHYGPNLCETPEYVYIKNGEFWCFKNVIDTNLFEGD